MISIIIPSLNGKHLLETCLASLVPQCLEGDEVIVVDNGSKDGTCSWLKETYHSVQCIALTENLGFSSAVNLGIVHSSGDLIALLNNDTEVLPNWLSSLRIYSEKYPDHDLFASRTIRETPPGRIDTAGDAFTIAGFGYKIGWMQFDGSEFDRVSEPFGASACAALYRRKLFDRIGLFDEDFFAFGEDLDVSFRALLQDHRCLYCPDAKVIHKVRSTATSRNTLFWYHRNLIWLIYKNFPLSLMMVCFPHIIANFTMILFKSIFKQQFVPMFTAICAGLSGIPKMSVKRKTIQKNRTASLKTLLSKMEKNWLAVHWNLHQAGKSFRHND